MSDIQYLTAEGLQNLKDKLHHMVTVERPAVTQEIADARDKGDLSENAEYDAAKEKQGLIEMEIAKIEDKIRNARIIDTSKLDASKVSILSTVKIKNASNGAEMKYTIVPENEADLKSGKISSTSPIAQGLMGKIKGDVVDIKVPRGMMKFEIVDISIE